MNEIITPEASTESSVDLINKEYSLQGISLRWRKINFKLYQNLELIKNDYTKTEQKEIRNSLIADQVLINAFKEAALGYSVEEVLKMFSDKDWQKNPERLAEFFEDKDWMLSKILEISLDAQADAKEKYILGEGVAKKLITTCLEVSDKKINYEPDSLDECRELMDFTRALFHDFFFITTSKIQK